MGQTIDYQAVLQTYLGHNQQQKMSSSKLEEPSANVGSAQKKPMKSKRP